MKLTRIDIGLAEEIAKDVLKQYPLAGRQQIELLRLARIGISFDEHSVAILDALKLAIGELPVAQISRFERALDALPRGSR